MAQQQNKKRRKKPSVWKNYGDGVQIYDVVFEVDKLDFIRLTKGKESSEYQSQHKKTVDLIVKYNSENKNADHLNISACRSIIQGERHDSSVTFKSNVKSQLQNNGVTNV